MLSETDTSNMDATNKTDTSNGNITSKTIHNTDRSSSNEKSQSERNENNNHIAGATGVHPIETTYACSYDSKSRIEEAAKDDDGSKQTCN